MQCKLAVPVVEATFKRPEAGTSQRMQRLSAIGIYGAGDADMSLKAEMRGRMINVRALSDEAVQFSTDNVNAGEGAQPSRRHRLTLRGLEH